MALVLALKQGKMFSGPLFSQLISLASLALFSLLGTFYPLCKNCFPPHFFKKGLMVRCWGLMSVKNILVHWNYKLSFASPCFSFRKLWLTHSRRIYCHCFGFYSLNNPINYWQLDFTSLRLCVHLVCRQNVVMEAEETNPDLTTG